MNESQHDQGPEGVSGKAGPRARMAWWHWLIVGAVALGGGLVAGGLLRPPASPQGALVTAASGTQYRAYKEMGLAGGDDFQLTDSSGQTVGLGDYAGKVLVVFFGYTNCPDVCPITLLAMRQVKQALEDEFGDVSDRFQGVFVSVDPERDTPEKLAAYVGHFDPGFSALSGASTEIAKAAALFGARYELHEPDANGNYLVDHSTLGYLVGPRGRVWAVYPGNADWQGMFDGARDLISIDWETS